jgi:hypothetical protein
MFNCRLSSVVALRALFLIDAAPKAHPKMKEAVVRWQFLHMDQGILQEDSGVR